MHMLPAWLTKLLELMHTVACAVTTHTVVKCHRCITILHQVFYPLALDPLAVSEP